MKRIFSFAAALAACALVFSCEKPLMDLAPDFGTEEGITIESGHIVSIPFSLNDVRGNEITAEVNYVSAEEYKVEVTFTDETYSVGLLEVTAPELILDETPFDVTVIFTDALNSRVAEKVINVAPVLPSNLVEEAFAANSFVVAPGSIVIFPTCKGNSEEKVAATSYKVVWQDLEGLYKDMPKMMDGKAVVRFADEKEGNVVIAALDADAKVLWSWHFWVVADTPKDVVVGEYTFMDRNIGALNLDEKSELSVGVIYQYGRKDPFPSIKFGEYALRPIYDGESIDSQITIVKNEAEDNLQNAIENPATFYNNVYVSGAKHGYSWITTDVTVYGAEKFKALWENGGAKTMYDPCPAGYVVAPTAAWEGAKAATTVEEIWDNDYVTFDDSAIGTNEKYQAGNRKKVQFRGCIYDGLRLTVSGEVNSNSTEFGFANCIGKPLPTAEVWCSNVDPDFEAKVNASYFRGMAVKVNTSGNGNYDDISAIKVNALSTSGKYTLNYALPVRCVKEYVVSENH